MALLAANAAENAALRAERDALAQRVFKLEEELALAQLHRFAPRSEKHMDRVFNEAENAALEADADEGLADCDETDATELPDTGLPEVEKPEGVKRGRKPLPANLPRQRVEYDLADDQKTCPCCRHPLHRMGELVTEQLHIEVKATVLQNARAKYACRNCERTGISTPVIIAPMPAQPLPGSIATASTLAFALVHKYVDGTPLYRLAQAFERVRAGAAAGEADAARRQLELTGKPGWLSEQVLQPIAALGLGDQVRVTGYVPAADLPALLSGAAALAFPSLYEGFGFPILEAQGCHVPVLTSDTSSCPEVAGAGALLVDPHDVSAIAAGLWRLLTEPALVQTLVEQGERNVQRFRWQTAARQVFDVLEQMGVK